MKPAIATLSLLTALAATASARADTCTDRERTDLHRRVRASDGPSSIHVTCDLSLRSSDRIRKKLVYRGAISSGLRLDCNGAAIDGRDTDHEHGDLIEVRSRQHGPANAPSWEPVRDVTIQGCRVYGAVRVWGMGKNGEAEHVRASSRRDAGHRGRVRAAAPTRIAFDDMTITAQGKRTPFYLAPGVGSVSLTNSEITGRSHSVGVYLDTESHHNTLRNNYFHVTSRKDYAGGLYTRKREEMAIDNSSNNTIMNNRFSTLEGGGIYLYRNCGEGGTVRHGTPSSNTIINNTFFYRRYSGGNPAIYVGSRTDSWWRVYCDDDEGFPWGSSRDDRSFARYNVIMGNQLYDRPYYDAALRTYRSARLGEHIRLGDRTNRPNEIGHNQIVTDATVETRLAGCYVSNGYLTNFIPDRGTVDLYEDGRGGPACGYRLTCNDGELSFGVPAVNSCSLATVAFACRASGDNAGCSRAAACGATRTAVAAKAACNLEYGTVSSAALGAVDINTIEVVRASDDVSDGRCWVGSTSARRGIRDIDQVGGRSVGVGCREHDRNGGDCHIRGELTCYRSLRTVIVPPMSFPVGDRRSLP